MLRATAARLARQGSVKTKTAEAANKGGFRPGLPEEPSTAMEKLAMEMCRPMPRPPPRTEEERARLRPLMIAYGKYRRKMHLIHEAKMNGLCLAKAVAFDALPNARRVEVINMPPEQPPMNRPLFTHTPPIPGFNAGDLTKKAA